MSTRWQFFLIGLAAGVMLTGILSLILLRPFSPRPLILQQTINPNTNISIEKTSTPGIEGRIDLNTATVDELASLPSIGPVKAQAIIDYREKYGDFIEIDELLYVPGIGENLLSTIRDFLYINH